MIHAADDCKDVSGPSVPQGDPQADRILGVRMDRCDLAVAGYSVTDPDRVALQLEESTLTFGALEERVLHLASNLRRRGVRPQSIVATDATATFDLVALLLAIMRLDAAFLPLEVNSPPKRKRFILEDSGATHLVTESADFDNGPWHVCELNALLEEPNTDNVVPTTVKRSGRQLAYVIYTSGTTGSPKGVAVSHEALTNYLQWCATEYYAATAGGSALLSSIAFDMSVTSLWGALAAGRPVLLVPNDEHIFRTAQRIAAHGAMGLLKVTPSHLTVFEGCLSETQLALLCDVLVLGGETVTAKMWNAWGNRCSRLYNEYGPTEGTVGNIVKLYDGAIPEHEQVPIGSPIPNTVAVILDTKGAQLTTKAVGEIHIGGLCLAEGYIGREELTATKFDSHCHDLNERLYATGDLGYRDTNGDLICVGRADNQIKVAGYRVEPSEIELQMTLIPGVDRAVVLACTFGGTRALIAAYTGAATESAVTRGLETALPSYMRPSRISRMTDLPLTQNGKTDTHRILRELKAEL